MRGKRKILFVLLGIFILTATSCSKDKNDDFIVKVNEEPIYLNEMMYYIYAAESEGNANEEMYQAFFEKSYWEETDEEGKTYRQLIKEEILENALLYEIFYIKAKDAGYTLDEDEQGEIKTDAMLFLESLTQKQKTAINVTEEELIKILEKISLAYYYYNDFLNTLEIDEAMSASMITEEDYRQYDVEYIYVSTVDYDEDYNPVPYPKEEKDEIYKKIEALLPQALDGKEFSELISEDEEIIECSDIGFMEGDEIFGAVFEEEALKLKNGQVTDKIIEEEDGYYIIKMVDDFSLESYEAEVENAIFQAQAEAFEIAFEKMKEDFKIVVNEKLWEPIILGELTFDPDAVTPEEYE